MVSLSLLDKLGLVMVLMKLMVDTSIFKLVLLMIFLVNGYLKTIQSNWLLVFYVILELFSIQHMLSTAAFNS